LLLTYVDNNVKRETVAAMRDPSPDFIIPDLLTVLTLILCITGYGEYCRSVFIGNLLITERWWTEAASDWSVVWHVVKCRWSGDWPMASSP